MSTDRTAHGVHTVCMCYLLLLIRPPLLLLELLLVLMLVKLMPLLLHLWLLLLNLWLWLLQLLWLMLPSQLLLLLLHLHLLVQHLLPDYCLLVGCSTKALGMPPCPEPSFARSCLMLVLKNNNIVRPLQLDAIVAHLAIQHATGYRSIEFQHITLCCKPMTAPHMVNHVPAFWPATI